MTIERVVKVIASSKDIDPEKVTEQTTLVADLGLDSLDTVELLMSLEEEFGISLEPDESIKTIGDLAAAVDQELAK
jgi:acyl carrier protein